MEITLCDVYSNPRRHEILWDLLKERLPDESISHKAMPTMVEHCDFVESRPYTAWLFIASKNNPTVGPVGSIYLTKADEIGISIFYKCRRNGYARIAIGHLREIYYRPRYLANINPNNERSIEFFRKMGAKPLQYTYELINP